MSIQFKVGRIKGGSPEEGDTADEDVYGNRQPTECAWDLLFPYAAEYEDGLGIDGGTRGPMNEFVHELDTAQVRADS